MTQVCCQWNVVNDMVAVTVPPSRCAIPVANLDRLSTMRDADPCRSKGVIPSTDSGA